MYILLKLVKKGERTHVDTLNLYEIPRNRLGVAEGEQREEDSLTRHAFHFLFVYLNLYVITMNKNNTNNV